MSHMSCFHVTRRKLDFHDVLLNPNHGVIGGHRKNTSQKRVVKKSERQKHLQNKDLSEERKLC